MRRDHVASTSARRHFEVVCPRSSFSFVDWSFLICISLGGKMNFQEVCILVFPPSINLGFLFSCVNNVLLIL